MAALATIATVAAGAATIIGAGATIYNGWQEQQQFEEQKATTAHELEKRGRAAFASSQRDALEKRLETKLLLSRQQAAAAASGGGSGADAPTILTLMGLTAERGDYAAQSLLYGGQSERDTSFQSAANVRNSKAAPFVGSVLKGVGDLLGGGARTANMAHSFGLI